MNREFAEDLDTDLERGHVLEWSELYALDAITPEERARIDAFLTEAGPAVASAFTERVRACRETVVSAYAAEQVEPPADLFDRIVAQLPAALPGPAAADTIGSTPVAPAASGSFPHAADELSDRRARRTSRTGRLLLAAAAAAVLVIGGATIGSNLLDGSSTEQEVLRAADVRTMHLDLDAGGAADLAVSGEQDAAVVTLTGVPAPDPGSVYQMWRIPADGTAPVSVGTMSGEDVAGKQVTELTDISAVRAIAITVEPEGGSVTPTLPIIAQIPLET